MEDVCHPSKAVSPGRPPYEIPVEGSLGLLALGAEGLRAWRRVRDGARPEPSRPPAADGPQEDVSEK